jgi:hypothetical protein
LGTLSVNSVVSEVAFRLPVKNGVIH